MKRITQASANHPAPDETVLRLDYESGVDGISDWALLRPGGAARRTCAVVLHGHGSHGDQLYTRRDVRESWLRFYAGHGVTILTPNLRDNAWMSPAAAADLHALIGWVRDNHGIDRFIFQSGPRAQLGTSSMRRCTRRTSGLRRARIRLGPRLLSCVVPRAKPRRDKGNLRCHRGRLRRHAGGAAGAVRPPLACAQRRLLRGAALSGARRGRRPDAGGPGPAFGRARNKKEGLCLPRSAGNHDAPCFFPEALEWVAARIKEA